MWHYWPAVRLGCQLRRSDKVTCQCQASKGVVGLLPRCKVLVSSEAWWSQIDAAAARVPIYTLSQPTFVAAMSNLNEPFYIRY